MTASEFTFLALGLLLGVACGAAIIEVLRARPPAPREVRVTVAPNAIHARFPATLSDPTASLESGGPAAGGPGDQRWHDDPPEPAPTDGGRRADDQPVTVAATAGVAAVAERDANAGSGTPVPSRPQPLWLSPPPTAEAALVPVPMSIEPDPLTAALRSTAAKVATVAMAGPRSGEAPLHPMAAASGAMSTEGAAAAAGLAAGIAAVSRAEGEPGGAGVMSAASTGGAAAPAASEPDTGPCADERRVADERCAVATRARAGAETAAETLRAAQRTHDEHMAAAEAGAAAADPRAVRTAKEAAQQRFRDARAKAATRDDVEGAARAWLAEINEINHDTREATARVERSRAAATALAMTLERLAVEADATRISAEQADEACIAAREALATCDEARNLEAAAAARMATPAPAAVEPPGAPADEGRIAAATPVPEAEFALGGSMGSRAGQDALLLRILRGDHGALQHAVARLAGPEPESARHWQTMLGGLAEALIARSIEASAFDFPHDHFFWGPFNQAQCRDISAGLSSLGFRFDGFGGWVDDRVPSQRDLAMAVGYAGEDPMRIRKWPNDAETRVLLADVRVAADEYVAATAGGLTLGELVTLLGRRADGLTELWNEWGTVRPVLLEGG